MGLRQFVGDVSQLGITQKGGWIDEDESWWDDIVMGHLVMSENMKEVTYIKQIQIKNH